MVALGKLGTKLAGKKAASAAKLTNSKGTLQNLGTSMTTGKGFGVVLGRSFCSWHGSKNC
jgi:hypothetical protein